MIRVLTIAGSDSSGAAGVQADLKTIFALGAHGLSVVTALTAQNSVGVHGVFPTPAAFVAAQLDAVLDDIGADAVKTGMLATRATVEAVADRLRRRDVRNVLVDTVMHATTGGVLLDEEGAGALRAELLPLATVAMPNLPEAAALTGRAVPGRAGMPDLARAVHDLGPEWVLLKGGHLPDGDLVDVLCGADTAIELVRPRVATPHTRGTGCTYSAAVATGLAFGMSVPDAVAWARDALQAAIQHSYSLGEGSGPLGHGAMLKFRPKQ
jgi:hydroxymethylpyrimidine/phosphomethylpyrimidine kinase